MADWETSIKTQQGDDAGTPLTLKPARKPKRQEGWGLPGWRGGSHYGGSVQARAAYLGAGTWWYPTCKEHVSLKPRNLPSRNWCPCGWRSTNVTLTPCHKWEVLGCSSGAHLGHWPHWPSPSQTVANYMGMEKPDTGVLLCQDTMFNPLCGSQRGCRAMGGPRGLVCVHRGGSEGGRRGLWVNRRTWF